MLATFAGLADAIRCALASREAMPGLGLDERAGVQSGEVGLRGDGVDGIAGHIAARIASIAGAGEVLISRTVADLITGFSGEALGSRRARPQGHPRTLAALRRRPRRMTDLAPELGLWREGRWGATVLLAGVADDDAELLRQAANQTAT